MAHELRGVATVSELPFLKKRLSSEQEAFVRSVLVPGDEEDEMIGRALGVRRLTDDERESLRARLAGLMSLLPDGSPDQAGVAIDEVIGLLGFY